MAGRGRELRETLDDKINLVAASAVAVEPGADSPPYLRLPGRLSLSEACGSENGNLVFSKGQWSKLFLRLHHAWSCASSKVTEPASPAARHPSDLRAALHTVCDDLSNCPFSTVNGCMSTPNSVDSARDWCNQMRRQYSISPRCCRSLQSSMVSPNCLAGRWLTCSMLSVVRRANFNIWGLRPSSP